MKCSKFLLFRKKIIMKFRELRNYARMTLSSSDNKDDKILLFYFADALMSISDIKTKQVQ